MTKYNLDKLIKIFSNNFYRSKWFTYSKEKRFLGFLIREEGFYYHGISTTDYIGKEPPKDHIFKDGIIWEKPEVIMKFQNDYRKRIVFESLKEADEFIEKITKGRNFL